MLVPDRHAEVGLIVEDAGTPGDVAADGRRAPAPAAGGADALGVQVVRDPAPRAPCRVGLEDPDHDRGLVRVDAPEATDRHPVGADLANDVIAIRDAAGGEARLDASPETPAGLIGDHLQLHRVHGPLETDVHVGDLAVVQGDDRDAGEGQPLVERRDILLVAGQAIQRLGDHDVEAAVAGVLQHALIAGPESRGTANGRVLVDGDNLAPTSLNLGPADPDLVLDRCRVLQVRAVAGVNGNAD